MMARRAWTLAFYLVCFIRFALYSDNTYLQLLSFVQYIVIPFVIALLVFSA